MATTIQNGQTCLEKRGMEERHTEITRSDYNIENQYSATHKDALSDGDAQGKGTGHGGHTHFYLIVQNRLQRLIIATLTLKMVVVVMILKDVTA